MWGGGCTAAAGRALMLHSGGRRPPTGRGCRANGGGDRRPLAIIGGAPTRRVDHGPPALLYICAGTWRGRLAIAHRPWRSRRARAPGEKRGERARPMAVHGGALRQTEGTRGGGLATPRFPPCDGEVQRGGAPALSYQVAATAAPREMSAARSGAAGGALGVQPPRVLFVSPCFVSPSGDTPAGAPGRATRHGSEGWWPRPQRARSPSRRRHYKSGARCRRRARRVEPTATCPLPIPAGLCKSNSLVGDPLSSSIAIRRSHLSPLRAPTLPPLTRTGPARSRT